MILDLDLDDQQMFEKLHFKVIEGKLFFQDVLLKTSRCNTTGFSPWIAPSSEFLLFYELKKKFC